MFDTGRIDHFYLDPLGAGWWFLLYHEDMIDSSRLAHIIQKGAVGPDLRSGRPVSRFGLLRGVRSPRQFGRLGHTLWLIETILIFGLCGMTCFFRDTPIDYVGWRRRGWVASSPTTPILDSSCIYSKLAPQPMKEDCLLTSSLEPISESYVIAKIAGIELCESHNRQHGTHYRSLMPTNLYGPQDNFNISNSDVVSALIRKAHEAKLAGFGWLASIGLDEGLASTYRWFLHHQEELRR